MCADSFPVEKHLTLGVDAVELEIDPLVFRKGRLCKLLFIGAEAALIIVAAVLPVNRVPGMWDADRLLLSLRAGKIPAGIEIDNLPHRFSPFYTIPIIRY